MKKYAFKELVTSDAYLKFFSRALTFLLFFYSCSMYSFAENIPWYYGLIMNSQAFPESSKCSHA